MQPVKTIKILSWNVHRLIARATETVQYVLENDIDIVALHMNTFPGRLSGVSKHVTRGLVALIKNDIPASIVIKVV